MKKKFKFSQNMIFVPVHLCLFATNECVHNFWIVQTIKNGSRFSALFDIHSVTIKDLFHSLKSIFEIK